MQELQQTFNNDVHSFIKCDNSKDSYDVISLKISYVNVASFIILNSTLLMTIILLDRQDG